MTWSWRTGIVQSLNIPIRANRYICSSRLVTGNARYEGELSYALTIEVQQLPSTDTGGLALLFCSSLSCRADWESARQDNAMRKLIRDPRPMPVSGSLSPATTLHPSPCRLCLHPADLREPARVLSSLVHDCRCWQSDRAAHDYGSNTRDYHFGVGDANVKIADLVGP